MTKNVIARMFVHAVNKDEYGTHVSLSAVCSNDPEHPNKSFMNATPSANLSMTIAPGKEAGDFFVAGEEVDLLFSKTAKHEKPEKPDTSESATV